MRSYTRDELLALTPSRYLADGYFDAAGAERRELATDYATAAATQLLAAELPAQELAFTYEALRLALPMHDGEAGNCARAATDEALGIVRQMIRQTNNEGLVTWLDGCVAAIVRAEDIEALLHHLQAVTRLYGVIAAMPRPEPPDGVSSAPAPVSSSP